MLFFLKDNKKPFILGLNVPKVTAYFVQFFLLFLELIKPAVLMRNWMFTNNM